MKKAAVRPLLFELQSLSNLFLIFIKMLLISVSYDHYCQMKANDSIKE